MKVHRAVVLVAMMAMSVALIVLFTATGLSRFDTHSQIALLVVVVAAAVGGVAFSWKRYGRRS
jgi:hypothetical protein